MSGQKGRKPLDNGERSSAFVSHVTVADGQISEMRDGRVLCVGVELWLGHCTAIELGRYAANATNKLDVICYYYRNEVRVNTNNRCKNCLH